MIRRFSILLASLWLLLAIASAAAGAATPSADDSRLLPYGPAAHLWLLPKAGNRLPSLVVAAAGRLPDAAFVPSPSVLHRGLRLVRDADRPFVPRALPRRSAPPRQSGGDPPLPA